MRILYTGPLVPWSTTEVRRRALIELGHDVVTVDALPHMRRWPRIVSRISWHVVIGPAVATYNAAVRAAARATRPDLVWVDQGIGLKARTVQRLRAATGARVLHYTTDDTERWRRAFRHYRRAIPFYDVHVTTNPLNIPFLERLGAPKVVRAHFGYDPALHRPPVWEERERARHAADLVFVGHWEPANELMVHAVRGAGLPLRVWGGGWKKASARSLRAETDQFHEILGDVYVKTLAGARISLGLLSKWNRNRSTLRTFEIPAVGGFLLGERTDDHQAYFEEGREAEYFASVEELLDKARFYLRHETAREAIARAGHDRCVKSPYTHHDRVRQILSEL